MTIFYTGNGDNGSTSAIGGPRTRKDDILFDLLGDIDELNSQLAVCILYINDEKLRESFETIQDNLFSMSAIIANASNGRNLDKVSMPKPDMLESEIKRIGKDLPELKKFIIPGGCAASSHLHVARSVARRTERKLTSFSKDHKINDNAMAYMNRLSSFLFVAALYMNHINKVGESNPRYV